MIRINLLPSDGTGRTVARRGARKSAAPKAGVMPFVIGLVALIGGSLYGGYVVYAWEQSYVNKSIALKNDVRKKKKDVEDRQDKLREELAQSEEIESKYEVAQALSPNNRVYWSEKLNMIAQARTELAVYVVKLQLDERIDELETQESIARREDWRRNRQRNQQQGIPEPKQVKRPVINQTLTIEAVAYGNNSPQRLTQIRRFQETLKALTWSRHDGKTVNFMDGMKPEFEQMPQRIDQLAGVEIMRFGFKVAAEPQLDRRTDSGEGAVSNALRPVELESEKRPARQTAGGGN